MLFLFCYVSLFRHIPAQPVQSAGGHRPVHRLTGNGFPFGDDGYAFTVEQISAGLFSPKKTVPQGPGRSALRPGWILLRRLFRGLRRLAACRSAGRRLLIFFDGKSLSLIFFGGKNRFLIFFNG